ncbi:hypothetical protein KVR01_002631 [Diaporthe batatas]|uniref:uncharacterized protein n=1 Tax=Diaporthe batatas TaxID=748121 RepID=UPI001D05337A|nr:uncharacterized protein KVR01_002631 [Diaporthe batatas]KAG8166942.1 hypothetical protein KVR01_002631 [Diaporthe batatas]
MDRPARFDNGGSWIHDGSESASQGSSDMVDSRPSKAPVNSPFETIQLDKMDDRPRFSQRHESRGAPTRKSTVEFADWSNNTRTFNSHGYFPTRTSTVDSMEWLDRKNGEDYPDWRQRTTPMAETPKEWPTVTVEKIPSPDYNDVRPREPESQFKQNFLHPPTPSRESIMGAFSTDGRDNDDTISLRSRRLSVNMDQSSRFGWWTLCLLLLALIMVVLAGLYSTGSAKLLMKDRFFTTSSANAILILRVLTEACALMMAALVVVVVEDLQWALASRPEGVSLLHFVGMDSGTGVWGLLRLLATADWKEKYSSLFRLIVICTIPLPGIILMGDIAIELVFFPQETYPVSAGIGNFNASYINQIDPVSLTALLVQMGTPAWSDRDSFTMDPLGPGEGLCTKSATDNSWAPCAESHLLTGGIVSISPQSDDLAKFPESTAYVVPRTRLLHLEYGVVHDCKTLFEEGHCYLIGTAAAASYWCASAGPFNELLFGSAYCPLAIQAKKTCLEDSSWWSPLVMASSLMVYDRYGTVNYDRGNFSILSVTDLTKPVQKVIRLEEYMLALSAVVPGFKPKTTNDGNSTDNANSDSKPAMKGDNSALAVYAVTALPINDNEVAKKLSLKAIRKAMSVPFNYFHENYFSRPSIFELEKPRAGLSADMYTNLSLAIMSHQVIAGPTSRWLFGLISGMLLTLCAAIIIATARVCKRRPQRCGYPTLDFAAVCAVKGGIPRPPSNDEADGHHGLHRSLTQLGQQPAAFQVASKIKGERVVLGR